MCRTTFGVTTAFLFLAPCCKRDETAGLPPFNVSADGRAVEVKRISDPEAERVPVLDKCGDPKVGEPKIRTVRASAKDRLSVAYGKHCFATVLLESLTVTCDGCD